MPWDSTVIAYTDQMREEKAVYSGDYLSTGEEASAYEGLLARLGDRLLSYETSRYRTQHLVTFNSAPEQDPIPRSTVDQTYLEKCAWVDLEHIRVSDRVKPGIFASFEVFLYSHYLSRTSYNGIQDEIYDIMKDAEVSDYRKYLTVLNDHYSMPVMVSAFGASTARGMWQDGVPEYHMTERQQGEAILSNYRDMLEAGAIGGCIESWQDAWYERTPNTLPGIDPTRTPYWKDVQSSDQQYGILAFEPGSPDTVCTVDGDPSEWTQKDQIAEGEAGRLSVKRDEAYLYFLVEKEGFNQEKDVLLIPLDITPGSGSTRFGNPEAVFERPADFIIVIDGKENSRVLVQARYEFLRANFGKSAYGQDPYIDPPEADKQEFVEIRQFCGTAMSSAASVLDQGNLEVKQEESRREVILGETGRLIYGNADPSSPEYVSLADFMTEGDFIEIRIPWNLLNFSDPSRSMIHGDYYQNYGVVNRRIDAFCAGLGDGSGNSGEETEIRMNKAALSGWGDNPGYHERLKQSYDMIRSCWQEGL